MDKYIVARLNGYGDTDMYLRIKSGTHHWDTTPSNASKLSYKRAVKVAAQLNRESSHSAYTIAKVS